MRLRHFYLTASFAAVAALAAPAANATIGPAPAGTVCVGTCGTDTADGFVTLSPLGTAMYGYVSTNGGVTGAGQISGSGGANGSLLTTPSFIATPGAILNFYFNYVTSDGAGYSDYAFSQLLNASSTPVATLFTARTTPSGNTSPGNGLPANDAILTPSTSPIINGAPTFSPLGSSSNTCWSAGCGYTGWIGASYTILTAGTYSLDFGVTNVGDTSYDSALAFDGVTIGGVPVIPPASVPEPVSLALLGTGLAMLGLVRRQRS